MDCIDILCNTIKTPLNRYVFVTQYIASPKHKVLFSAVMKQTAIELQKYGTKGQIISTVLIQLVSPIRFTSSEVLRADSRQVGLWDVH